MARRLISQNRRREARRQRLILNRLAAQFRGILERDIASAMADTVDRWEQSQVVDLPRNFPDRIGAAYHQMAAAAIRAFASRILDQGKASALVPERKFIDFGQLMTRLALSWIAQEAMRRRIQLVTETTRRQIVNQVEQGYRDGIGTREIGKNIRNVIPAIARFRADTIARTETHAAANYGANEAARATNLPLRREWLAAHDHRTRTVSPLIGDGDLYGHREADGQIVGMNEPFLIRRLTGGVEPLMFPGDPSGSPGNTINCRCTTAYIVDDGIDDEPEPGAMPAPAQLAPAAASPFSYQSARMPETVQEADQFITANGIALNARLSGMNILAMHGAFRAALEVTERFGLKPLTGIGPITRFGIRQIKGVNAAIQLARMADNTGAVRNVAFFHTPVKFGDVKEYAKQHATALKTAARYDSEAVAALKVLEGKGKADPRVLAARARMEKGSYAWTYDSILDPSQKARVVTYHEYGHVLHLVDRRIGKLIDDFLSSEKPLDSGWQYLVSKYGGSSSIIKNSFARRRFDEREFIAESFAIYMHAPPSQWFRIHPALLKIFREADKKT